MSNQWSLQEHNNQGNNHNQSNKYHKGFTHVWADNSLTKGCNAWWSPTQTAKMRQERMTLFYLFSYVAALLLFKSRSSFWTGERERERKDQMPVCILCILDSWWFPETLCNFTVQLLRALLRMFLSHQTAVQVWTLQWRSIPRTRLNTSMIQSYRKLRQNVKSCVHRPDLVVHGWLKMKNSQCSRGALHVYEFAEKSWWSQFAREVHSSRISSVKKLILELVELKKWHLSMQIQQPRKPSLQRLESCSLMQCGHEHLPSPVFELSLQFSHPPCLLLEPASPSSSSCTSHPPSTLPADHHHHHTTNKSNMYGWGGVRFVSR